MLDLVSAFVTRQRVLVLLVSLAVSAVCAAFLPRLQADFTPTDLFAKFDDQEAVAAEFRAEFGNTDNVLLVLLRGDDVLTQPALQYVHDVTTALRAREYAARVDAITSLPLPKRPGPAERAHAEMGVLAALYTVSEATADQLGAAVGMIRGAEPRVRLDPDVPDALLNLAAGGAAVRPAVEGERVTEDDVAAVRAAVASSRLLRGRLVAVDGTLTAIAISLAPDITRNAALAEVVADVGRHLSENPPPAGLMATMGGLPFVRTDVIAKMRADQSVMLPLSLLVCVLTLFASFRWVPAIVLSTLAVVLSAVILVGGMAAFGEPFNIINNIVPLLIIIIGISNAIHLVNRYGEELRAGRMRVDACREAVKRMIVACFFTSFTTAIGFVSLVVSRTEVMKRFGIVAGIGVLVAYVLTITTLPAALTYARPPARDGAATREGRIEVFMEWLTRGVLRHPLPVLAVAFVLFIVSIQQAATIKIDSAVLDQFRPDDPIVTTTRLVEEKLGGVRPLEVYLSASTQGRFDDPEVLNAIDDLARWAAQQDGVLGTLSYADFLHSVEQFRGGDVAAPFASRARVASNRAMLASGDRDPIAPYVNASSTRARLNVGVADFGALATIDLADRLELKIAERFAPFPDITVRLTGDAYVGSKGLNMVVSDLLGSLGLAVFVIFGFMTLLFRSARLAALSVPPNILPLVATMAFMKVAGVPLNAATAIIFSISIGMAVDGSIHVLTRFGEEVGRRDSVDDALVAAARGTGKAIIMTCLSLMLGFGVMLTSSFVPIQRFGQLIAMTVFGCLLATIIVLPALLKVGWLTPKVAGRLDD